MDKKARATTRGRGITGVTMRHADERVVWWCTIEKFGRGSDGFTLGFGATEVRVVTINQVRECGRVKRMKNGADVESTDGEVCRARIQFDATRKEKKARRGGQTRVCWRANSRKIAEWMRGSVVDKS